MADRGMTAGEVRKLKFPQLAAFAWLTEEGRERAAVAVTNEKTLRLFDILREGETVTVARAGESEDRSANVALLDSLGGSREIDLGKLADAGFLVRAFSRSGEPDAQGNNRFWKFFDDLGHEPFSRKAPGLVLLRVTAEGVAWWNGVGKARYEALREARDAERAEVARTVVIGVTAVVYPDLPDRLKDRLPSDFVMPFKAMKIVRPTFTATVVKESASRVYIKDVRRIRTGGGWGTASDERRNPISGHAPNQFVEPGDIMADGASEQLVLKLLEIDRDTVETFNTTVTNAVESILDPLRLAYERAFQAAAMRDDLVREAIAADRADKPSVGSATPLPKAGP